MHELHQALNSLYDPRELRRSLLVEALPLDTEDDVGLALRRLLVDAIEALKPDQDVPAQSTSWRIYHVLSQRYAEQSTQGQVATDLGLSVRHLRRLEKDAREAIADYLWRKYDLAASAQAIQETASLLDEDGGEALAAEGMLSREQELEWLHRSTSTEPTSAQQVVDKVLLTASPLLRALHVDAEPSIPDSLPPLAAEVTALRQGLLSVLTAATRMVPGGRVTIEARRVEGQVVIAIASLAGDAAITEGAGCEADELRMARQLVEVSGGELEIVTHAAPGKPFTASLRFQAVEQIPVLAIDDNPDVLSLLKRYVSETRYCLAGVSDLPLALGLLEELRPRIIVLDVMLPGIDGWQLLGRLREHPKSRGIPIVVCTVLAQQQLALTLGAAGFLRKPVSRAAFLAALDAQVGSMLRERR